MEALLSRPASAPRCLGVVIGVADGRELVAIDSLDRPPASARRGALVLTGETATGRSRSGYPVQIAPRLERVMTEPTPEEVREMHPDLVLDFATQNAREFQQGQPCQTITAA